MAYKFRVIASTTFSRAMPGIHNACCWDIIQQQQQQQQTAPPPKKKQQKNKQPPTQPQTNQPTTPVKAKKLSLPADQPTSQPTIQPISKPTNQPTSQPFSLCPLSLRLPFLYIKKKRKKKDQSKAGHEKSVYLTYQLTVAVHG